jgi:large subunit ribosomal protein L23
MNNENIYKVLLSPKITEKTTRLKAERQYVFKVMACANKPEVKDAIKSLFKVEVESVRVCNVCGKTRRFGNIEGRRKDWKKAYVTLKEGYAIKSE